MTSTESTGLKGPITASIDVLPFDIVCEDGVDHLVYRNDTDKALELSFALSYRRDLADIDQFIFDLPDDAPIKADLKLWRAQAVQYFLRRDNHHEMVMFALQKLLTIYERVRAIRRENSLRPFAETGDSFRKAQSTRAKRERTKWITDETSLNDIVASIACSHSGREESAKELWRQLYGELDKFGASPSESDHQDNYKKSVLEYTLNNDKRATLTFGSFEGLVTKIRKSD